MNGCCLRWLIYSFVCFVYAELKIQPALNSVLVPVHLRGAGGVGLMSGLNSASPSQDSTAAGSPSTQGGGGGTAGEGAIHPPADVCSSSAGAGESLGGGGAV